MKKLSFRVYPLIPAKAGTPLATSEIVTKRGSRLRGNDEIEVCQSTLQPHFRFCFFHSGRSTRGVGSPVSIIFFNAAS
jgi:hypothetical protein